MNSSLFGMVMRHGGEEMVSNVSIRDVMMEVVDDGTIGAIDGKSSTTLEVPDILAVVGQFGVGVLQVGD